MAGRANGIPNRGALDDASASLRNTIAPDKRHRICKMIMLSGNSRYVVARFFGAWNKLLEFFLARYVRQKQVRVARQAGLDSYKCSRYKYG